jgi:ParB/RepB/Spo0J family partition protein
MAGKKTPTEGVTAVGKDRNIAYIDLHFVVSNDRQSRGHGVCPALEAAGYGLFRPVETHPDNKPVMAMLLSGTAEEQQQGCGLIDEHFPQLANVISSMKRRGQMQNIRVNPAMDDDGKELTGKYDVRVGMRRCVAKAYIHAQSGGKVPARMLAEIVERGSDKDGFLEALEENTCRANESPIDQAKMYLQLKKQDMKLKEIAEEVGEDYQTVRNRLQLLQLPQEWQDKIHEGKVGHSPQTLKKLLEKHSAPPKGGKSEGEGNGEGSGTGEGTAEPERKRVLTLKQTEAFYTATERPVDHKVLGTVTEAQWALVTEDVRKFWADQLKVEYHSRRELKKMADDAQKAALAAAQAAAEAENDGE